MCSSDLFTGAWPIKMGTSRQRREVLRDVAQAAFRGRAENREKSLDFLENLLDFPGGAVV